MLTGSSGSIRDAADYLSIYAVANDTVVVVVDGTYAALWQLAQPL